MEGDGDGVIRLVGEGDLVDRPSSFRNVRGIGVRFLGNYHHTR